MIINPFAPPSGPIEKRITLKTKGGEQVSTDFTLADDKGRQSAAEYVHHLFATIKDKLGEPAMFQGFQPTNPNNQEELKHMILFIASFHDAMFGTFNRASELPDEERSEFIEIFLLACATVLEGKNILIDLAKGKISNESAMI